jgi:hypothetical protein
MDKINSKMRFRSFDHSRIHPRTSILESMIIHSKLHLKTRVQRHKCNKRVRSKIQKVTRMHIKKNQRDCLYHLHKTLEQPTYLSREESVEHFIRILKLTHLVLDWTFQNPLNMTNWQKKAERREDPSWINMTIKLTLNSKWKRFKGKSGIWIFPIRTSKQGREMLSKKNPVTKQRMIVIPVTRQPSDPERKAKKKWDRDQAKALLMSGYLLGDQVYHF